MTPDNTLQTEESSILRASTLKSRDILRQKLSKCSTMSATLAHNYRKTSVPANLSHFRSHHPCSPKGMLPKRDTHFPNGATRQVGSSFSITLLHRSARPSRPLRCRAIREQQLFSLPHSNQQSRFEKRRKSVGDRRFERQKNFVPPIGSVSSVGGELGKNLSRRTVVTLRQHPLRSF